MFAGCYERNLELCECRRVGAGDGGPPFGECGEERGEATPGSGQQRDSLLDSLDSEDTIKVNYTHRLNRSLPDRY